MDAATADLFNTEFWVTAGIIFFLLFLSGFFSGSETALTAASKARMHQLAKSGNKRAKRVADLIEEKEKLIGAILLGNNLVNILASALATSLFMKISGEQGVVYATLVMTLLVLIFAEVLPKSYAIANPDKMALSVAGIIKLIVGIFSPIIVVVRVIVRGTLKIVGVDITEMGHALSAQDDIRSAIDLHRHEGGLIKEDQQMLGSILDLGEVNVEDVMIHRSAVHAIDINATADEIIANVVRSPYTRLPIFEDAVENIVGVLHAKDVLGAIRRTGGQMHRFNVRRVMSKPWFVPETTTLKDQLNAFLERKAHMALVVDEFGDIQGLVTLEDILEEIVGDITDEHDASVPGVRVMPDGSAQVEGTVPVRDLNRMFDWNLDDDCATTIAGLVIHRAETIPIVGKSYRFDGFQFEVTARSRNQITGLNVRKLT